MKKHDHTFGQDEVRAGEHRTLLVILITAVMMIIEIAAGLLFGSMALLADGLHMGSHAIALTLTWIAYILARRYADDRRFSFGTGKVNSLAAFASAMLLALFALLMAWESVARFFNPVAIAFNQAILVAVIGLIVNGASVFILGVKQEHEHHHESGHSHDHHHHHQDHNLRAAYFHVLADALTSLLAIAALLAGKYFGLNWMDPLMGVVGAILVARWSWGLLRDSGRVLLDRQAPLDMLQEIERILEQEMEVDVIDIHIWSIGPGINAGAISLIDPLNRKPAEFKSIIPREFGIVHLTLEVNGTD